MRIRDSLASSFAAPIILTMLLVATLSYFMIVRSLSDNVLESIHHSAEITAELTTHAVESGNDAQSLQRVVSFIGAEPALHSIVVVDAESKQVIASNQRQYRDQPMSELPARLESLIALTIKSQDISLQDSHSNGVYCVTHSATRLEALGDWGWVTRHLVVLVAMDTHEALQQIDEKEFKALGILLIIIASATLLILHRLHCRVIEPTGRILSAIDRRSRGQLEARITLPHDDEFKRIADAYNHQLDDLDTLQQQTEKLAKVAELSYNAVIITDKERRVEWVNSAFTRMTGFKLADIQGKQPSDVLFHGSEQRASLQRIHHQLQAGHPVNERVSQTTRHGEQRIIDMNIHPLHDERGGLAGYVGVQHDVTDIVTMLKRLENYYSVLDAQPNPIILLTPALNIEWANQSACQELDQPLEALRRCAFKQRLPSGCVQHFEQPLKSALAGKASSNECQWFDARNVLVIHKPLFDKQGQLQNVMVVIQDISARKRIEHSLRDTENRLRAIIDNTDELVGLLSLDGKVLEANRRALEIGGVDKHDVIGRVFWQTPWWNDNEIGTQQLRWALEEARSGHRSSFHTTHPDADGCLHDILFTLTPVLNARGEVIYLVPEGRDITHETRSLKVLARSESNLALAQKLAHVGSWALDLHSRRLDLSDEAYRILGLEPQSRTITFAHYEQWVHLDDKAELSRLINQAIKAQTRYRQTFRIQRRDGELRWCHSIAEVQLDPQGLPLKLAGSLQDITDATRDFGLRIEN